MTHLFKAYITGLLLILLSGYPLSSVAITLEEQVDNIESSKKNIHKEISDIFKKYKKSLQITTGQPKVIDSDENTVTISMEVFVRLADPNLSLKISNAMNKYFSFPRRYMSYLEVSIVSGGNHEAWEELTSNGLRAQISMLNNTQSIPLFGNFRNWFTVKISTEEVFKVTFSVDKKNIKLDATPTTRIITKNCGRKNGHNMCG